MPYPKFEVGEGAKAFWRKVRGYRRMKEMSQHSFAREIRSSQAHVSRAESGSARIPDRGIVLEIAELLDLDLIQREELLAIAGYSFSDELAEAALQLVEKGRGQSHYGRFSSGQLEMCLEKCLVALQTYHTYETAYA